MLVTSAIATPVPTRKPKEAAKPQPIEAIVPAPENLRRDKLDDLPDMSKAVRQSDVGKLPSTEERFDALKQKMARDKPAMDKARAESARLEEEARKLKRRLIEIASRIERLEAEKIDLDDDIVRLAKEDKKLSAGFAHDRIAVGRLLAVLERLQHDVPPAMAMKPDDVLGATRGAMLLGASLPSLYGQAAELARRISAIQKTRANLIEKRAAGRRNAAALMAARLELDSLLVIKEREAGVAIAYYGDLRSRLAAIAIEAADLKNLLERVARLRQSPARQQVTLVMAAEPAKSLRPGSLLRPMVGGMAKGGFEGVGGSDAPGVTFTAGPGAQVIAPSDGTILFAGNYQKSGKVLILEMAVGYDLVLVGIDRIFVRPRDQILAGEPLGVMPQKAGPSRLYFELRQNGRGTNPASWFIPEKKKAKS